MATDNAHTVRILLRLSAPPETVFAAWVKPEVMRTWLFRNATNEIRRVESDLRKGGALSVLAADAAGEETEHFGEYLEIESPHRLMFTLEVPKLFSGVTTVSVELAYDGGGSTMSFVQTGVRKEITEGSWRTMFRRLESVLP